jgi:pimeloyl-ACP methyl ester carboxylesterase
VTRRTIAALAVAAMAMAGCAGSQPGVGQSTVAPPATSPTPASVCQPVGEPTGGYLRRSCTVDAPSLAGNLLGDPATLQATVLLPDDYQSTAKAYPVVYVLAGWNETGDGMATEMLRSLPTASTGHRSILTFADGANGLGGSFYANSSVTGNWDDAIATDLVGFVDSHFRTLPKAAARGIAGHSMGGTGALSVGMKHPDRFGAIYAISAGLFDADGFEARFGNTADPMVIQSAVEIGQSLAALPAAGRGSGLVKQASRSGSDVRFALAYGAAFAPDPEAPLLMGWPYKLDGKNAVRDDAIYESWEAGFGGLTAKIQKHGTDLRALEAFVIEYGTKEEQPWISNGGHYFATLLTTAGVLVTEQTFEGGHSDRLGDRLANAMLPFMEAKLAAS